jgi:hypothetical protein
LEDGTSEQEKPFVIDILVACMRADVLKQREMSPGQSLEAMQLMTSLLMMPLAW